MIFYAFSVFSAIVVGLCIAEELPVTTCKRNSSNYFNCLKLAIQESWPRFIKGLPEFDFPSLDPLPYNFGEFKFERNEIYGRVILTNVICIGLTNITFLAVRAHFLDDGFHLEIDTNVPKLFIEGDCNAQGKVGGFEMGGKGRFNLTIENIKGTWDLIGHVTNDTWIVEHFRYFPSVGNMKFYFNNLFNDNEELNGKVVFNANGIYGEGFIANATIYEIDIIMSKVIAESYVSGKANLIGIQAHGAEQLNLTLNDNKITWDVTGYIKNDTWIVEHFQCILTIGSLRTQLSGFFDDIKELNNVLEDFINEYWPPMYRVIGSEVLQQLGDPLLTDLTNRFFSKVSFSKIFP